MTNVYIVHATFDSKRVEVLNHFGIKVREGFDRFDIGEDALYINLKPYLDAWNASVSIISQFSDEDINNAGRLVYNGIWANGYPMRDNDNGYQQTTYDDTHYCSKCGIGLIQKEPFRLKKAPDWKPKRKMFSLNWVYDELFVSKDLYESVFQPIGIKCEKVLLYKKETTIDDTLQLIIPQTGADLALDGYPFEICDSCGHKRYDLIRHGFFPPFRSEPGEGSLYKSKEWFGTGASARKYIFLSGELRQRLKPYVDMKYMPCKVAKNT